MKAKEFAGHLQGKTPKVRRRKKNFPPFDFRLLPFAARLARKTKLLYRCASYKLAQHFPLSLLMGEGARGVRVKPALRYSFVGQDFILPSLARKAELLYRCASSNLAPHFPLSLPWERG